MDLDKGAFLEYSVFIVSIVCFFAFTDLGILSIIGCSSFIYFCVKFFDELGSKIEIRDLMIIIALLQWVVGPVLSYSFFPDDPMYHMSVDESEYMGYVVPASLLFIAGLYLPIYRKEKAEDEKLDKIREIMKLQPNLDLILIGVGIFANFAESFTPSSIRFFLYLMGSLRYIGLYFLLLNDTRSNKLFYVIPILMWLFMHAIGEGMFHDMLLWMGFLFLVAALIYKINLVQKMVYFFSLIILVSIVQIAKHEYRKEIGQMESQQGSLSASQKGSVFSNIVQNKLTSPSDLFSSVYLSYNVTRINQGWIIARIMNYTPKIEPFAEGETIKDGLYALFPRFMFPDKAIAGGKKNFERFTGKHLREGTSMNLSVMGEAYANFGTTGGMMFMFFIAFLFNFVLGQIFRLSDRFPSLILWIPLIFLQVVKAETDFVTVINYLFKACVVVALVFFSFQKLFKFKF